jgi:hypothetical protein
MSYGSSEAAAAGGHLEVYKWLYAHGCDMSQDTCTNAAGGGHLDVLKWAHEDIDCFWSAYALAAAAEGGHLEALKYCVYNGCEWDEYGDEDLDCCMLAAQGGHLVVLKWLREEQYYPWDENTSIAVADYGHPHVLQYLRENGCP